MPEVENVSPQMDGLDPKNRATDLMTVARVEQEVISRLPEVRSNKNGLVEDWAACFDVWNQKHRVRLYEGASDLYIPVVRNTINTFVAQVKQEVFPTSARMYIESNYATPQPQMQGMGMPGGLPQMPGMQGGMGGGMEGGGLGGLLSQLMPQMAPEPPPGPSPEAIGELLRHFVEQAEVERHIEGLIRNAFVYGTAIVKFPWVTKEYTAYRRKPAAPPGLFDMLNPEAQKATEIVPERVRLFNGPAFRVVDPLRFYVDPITRTNLEDMTMVFEDVDVTFSHLKAMEKAEIYHDVKRVLSARNAPNDESTSARNERLSKTGISVESGSISGTGGTSTKPDYGAQFVLTEIWAMYDLDDTGYEVPCKIVVCNGHVLEIRSNPFLHQQLPYRAWKLIDFPDMFFGQGLITGMKHQQYAVNALFNQGLDSAVYQSNPIIVANAMAFPQGPAGIKLGYRSIIMPSGNVNDNFKVVQFPDTSATSLGAAGLITQSIQDFNGAPPIQQGNTGSKQISATEAQIVGKNASATVQNFIRGLEASILTPMLKLWYFLGQQFLDEEVWLKVTKEDKFVNLTADDLIGDYKLRWLTSSQIGDRMQAKGEEQQADAMLNPQPMGMAGGLGGTGLETPAEMGGQPLG